MELTVRNLSFSYGRHTVLSDVSFEAASAQTICLLGRNGAGKSTLFRCLLGLESGYSGSIGIDGQEASRLSRRELAGRLAYIPQTSDPTFDYPVVDVVLMGRTSRMGLGSTGTRQDEEAALAALDRLGIARLANCGYARISGGERQLVLIARALAQQAGAIVMDEPTANLDYGNQHKTMQLVEGLRTEGYLVVMSTHNPQHALNFATSVLVLDGGTIVAQGAPEEVMDDRLLRRIYDIPVHVDMAHSLGGHERRVCVPGD